MIVRLILALVFFGAAAWSWVVYSGDENVLFAGGSVLAALIGVIFLYKAFFRRRNGA